jgi:ribosomal protein S18 acetylase RimI-like enzyme
VTAAVLPEYRKRGIFQALFTAARQEARNWDASELLLVSYPGSADGTAVVRHLGFPYKSSEYRMEATVDTIPPLTESRLALEPVDATNVATLSHLLAISFGDSGWNAPKALLQELGKVDKRYYLAKWDNIVIGQIGVIAPDHNVYIQAVGIAPEWRRNGYGRRLLAATVQKMLAEGRTHFALDVATDNPQALSLYQSVGFYETTAYDYYTVPLDTA